MLAPLDKDLTRHLSAHYESVNSMRSLRIYTLSLLVALVVAVPSLRAQSQSTLSPAGTVVRLDTLRSGNYNLHDGRLTIAEDGTPVLLNAADRQHSDICWSQIFAPSGVIGRVFALAVSGDNVFIGGEFQVAGTVLANNIVRWNAVSKQWLLLGDTATNGTNGPVYSLLVHNNDLFVGGRFENAGQEITPGIARYAISQGQWYPLSSGILFDSLGALITPRIGAYVYTMAAEKNSLFVGGKFSTAGGDTIPNLAEYDIVNDTWRKPCRAGTQAPNDIVRALVVRDSILYIGGGFTSVGGVAATRVAQLDLRTGVIAQMGQGFNANVNALAVHDGSIVAGGEFTTSGTRALNHLARWDGISWQDYQGGVDDRVYSLLTVGNDLYASGTFLRAGGVGAPGIAVLRGGVWNPLGSGLTDSIRGVGFGLAWDGANIYAGGAYTTAGNVNVRGIAAWDGTAWNPLGGSAPTNFNGVEGPVYGTARFGSNIYVVGDFLKAGGVPAARVARFDLTTEQWYPLGPGIPGAGSLTRTVATDDDGNVYVGGIFTNAGGGPITGLARWNGSTWESLGSGIGGATPYVFSLLSQGDSLIVGGAFETAGGIASPKVALWRRSSQSWSAVGSGIAGDTVFSFVSALGLHSGKLYAGGLFSKAGDGDARNVAEFDGSTWRAMGAGLNGRVSAFASLGGTLYVGGEFTRSGADTLLHIARWNGTAWSKLDGGVDGAVNSLLLLDNNRMLAMGDFSHADTIATRYTAIWNSSADMWERGVGDANLQIRSGVLFGDAIYLGGDFTQGGGTRSNFIARVLAGEWSALGSDPTVGLNGTVLGLAFNSGGQLYAGGLFSTAGGARTNGIARWSGTHWLSVGGGLRGTRREAHALLPRSDGSMLVGGLFDSVATIQANSIAAWSGTAWQPLGSGFIEGTSAGTVNALAEDGNDVIAGGRFDRADGSPAVDLARWNGSTWSGMLGAGARRISNLRGEIRAVGVLPSGYVIGGAFDTLDGVPAQSLAFLPRGGGPVRSIVSLDHLITDTMKVSVSRIAVRNGIAYIGVNSIGKYLVERRADSTLIEEYELYTFDGTTATRISEGGGIITALSFDDVGRLFIGGSFPTIQGKVANGFATYVDGTWQGYQHGFQAYDTSIYRAVNRIDTIVALRPGYPHTVAAARDTVWTGGAFSIAGVTPSFFIARWTDCDHTLDVKEHTSRIASSISASLAPNPAQDRAVVVVEGVAHQHVRVDLLDTRGGVVLTAHDEAASGSTLRLDLDLSSLPSGSYFCRVTSGGSSTISPVVVAR